jgi:hypothetical protein
MRRWSKRKLILLAVVPALVLVAAGAADENNDPPNIVEAKPAAKTNIAATRAADAGELNLEPKRRDAVAGEPGNVFTSKTWYVPPPPPPPTPPPPPPPPTAPPLPFTYLGQLQDGGKSEIFLVKDDRVLTVKQGDIVEGNYRVDGIVGSKLELTYLPLGIKQTLNVGTEG